jgi:hypothetical protein
VGELVSSDIDRLYQAVERTRAETAAATSSVLAEVQAYRRELNGKLGAQDERLRALERGQDRRDGEEKGRAGIGRLIAAVAGVASAVSVAAGFLLDRLPG